MRHLHVLMVLFITLGFSSFNTPSYAALLDPLTTIELETAVHFLAPDGSDLVVEAGTYAIEPAEEWIRLMAGERYEAVLIEAKKGSHELEIEHTLAVSIPGKSEGQSDNHYVMLLLPGGQTLEATGTYSGIRARGFFNKAFNNVEKNTNRAYRQARSTAKKATSQAKRTVKKTRKQVQKSAKQGIAQAKKGAQNIRKGVQQAGKKAVTGVRKGRRAARNAALHAKLEVEKTARRVASKVRRSLPKIRSLSTREKNLARSVFRNTINYNMVRITNTLGAGGRPWTTNTPPLYTINVGSDYHGLTATKDRKRLLIHELVHVWQGQHLVPFTLNSAAHQALSVINNGGDVAAAYSYTVGKPWRKYNVEQQASIVEHWFTPANLCFENGPCGGGMKTTDPRYRYIRDHIRKDKAR